MATFNGKLIEVKQGNNYVEFPLKYINAESYDITPDQRMEVAANRASSGVLVRNTCSHTASKIEFDTTILTNRDVKIISTLLANAYTNALERKLTIRYYVPNIDDYKTATVYVPDVDFHIMRVDKTTNTIWYNSIRYAFIEY